MTTKVEPTVEKWDDKLFIRDSKSTPLGYWLIKEEDVAKLKKAVQEAKAEIASDLESMANKTHLKTGEWIVTLVDIKRYFSTLNTKASLKQEEK